MTFPGDQPNKSSLKLYVNKAQLTELVISIKSDKCVVFLPFQVIQAVVFLNSWSKRLTGQCSLNNEDADSRRWLEAWAWLLISVRGVEESLLVYSQACLQLKDVTSLSLSPNHTRFFKGPETYREECNV